MQQGARHRCRGGDRIRAQRRQAGHNHTNAEGASINMGVVAVFDQVEDAFLTGPARGLSQLR
jgi:hypothetical protein